MSASCGEDKSSELCSQLLGRGLSGVFFFWPLVFSLPNGRVRNRECPGCDCCLRMLEAPLCMELE